MWVIYVFYVIYLLLPNAKRLFFKHRSCFADSLSDVRNIKVIKKQFLRSRMTL